MAVITISRQFGAGGRTLGKLLAKKLKYNFIEEDIIQRIAEKANVSKDWVKSTEKEAGKKLSSFLASLISKRYMERLVGEGKGYIDEHIYIDALYEVIQKIAEEDNIIIVGRGGQYILKDHPNAFHVHLIAEKEDRITFMEKQYNLTRASAAQVVKQQGKRRLNLYKKFHKKDYDHPELYHVTLNMSKLSMDKATDFIYRMVADVVCHLAD